MRISQKLIFLNVLSLAITVMVFSGIISLIIYPNAISLSQDLADETTDLISDDINEKLLNALEVSSHISENPLVIQENTANSVNNSVLETYFENILDNKPDIFSLYVAYEYVQQTFAVFRDYDTDKLEQGIYETIGYNSLNTTEIGFDYREEGANYQPWFWESIDSGEPGITDPYYDTALLEQPMVSLTAPIYSENNTLLGIVGCDLIMNSLFNLISEIELPDGGFSILTTGDGTILTHPSTDWDYANNWDRETTYKFSDWAEDSDLSLNEVVNSVDKDNDGGFTTDDYYIVVKTVDIDNWKLVLFYPNAEIQGWTTLGLIIPTIIAIIVGLIFAGINLYIVKNDIDKTVSGISNTAKKVADGDLTVKVENPQTGDEFEEMAVSFNLMITNLSNLIERTSENISILQSSSESLVSASEETNAASEEVSSTSQSMSMAASQQAEMIAHSVGEIMKIGEIVDEISESISNNAEIIGQLALQTNILALNAGIEASRAGDYGRGFAVVAENVRRLSEESKVAAEEINEVAGSIAATLNSAFEGIRIQIEEVAALSEETAASAEEVAAAAEEVTSTMEQVSGSTQQLNDMADESTKQINQFKFNK